jgi:hypothetical protein
MTSARRKMMDIVPLQTLCMVLGEPAAQLETIEGTAAVRYQWPCGCSGMSADGRKCRQLRWCVRHEQLLWLSPKKGEDRVDKAI